MLDSSADMAMIMKDSIVRLVEHRASRINIKLTDYWRESNVGVDGVVCQRSELVMERLGFNLCVAPSHLDHVLNFGGRQEVGGWNVIRVRSKKINQSWSQECTDKGAWIVGNLQTEVQLQSMNSLCGGGRTSAEMWFVIWYSKAREGW